MKTQTESWYNEHLADYDNQIAEGKFCNDRNTASGSTWAESGITFYYAGYERVYTKKTPTLACPSGDVYTLKAGAIAADEVSFAGGVYGTENNKYYLYNGQYYWTMSPASWYSPYSYTYVLAMWNDGTIGAHHVDGDGIGVRPVINLRADTIFSSGDGTIDSPFTVQ